ncbi:tRNA 5-methoxyuridine(34)/uridine 5-oxyacetic acid(34) synthase CmoB [Echinimonas agarilytica]|uniref:tRNA U34 carboxymethyltransferase n=1 Tax=Echinimonas agarilytica TaxID=1215918 RepID=A0AA41W6S2_9GAMM|nr:tRNA 5-methoxyuridine(34)/uridine 5-oxyacetic acid(34) synthase CmoB [Echinimonas agarilytica]MCM2679686.1 tRNA 5-methoxyuridine(34)/uridine 5-oxyacetic acid(34) synthase CmoB [Echinimonas agarilytica]
MIHFDDFYRELAYSNMSHWLETIPGQLGQWQRELRNSKFAGWQRVLNKLPEHACTDVNFSDMVRIGPLEGNDESLRNKLEGLLTQFHPWRKGPYHVHGLHIDTEWRSDWKWDRIKHHIQPLEGRTILDVGCGNGYHMWRMKGAGASMVVGIDPAELFLMQFMAIKRLAGNPPGIHLLPIGVEQMPALQSFDTVFSMGVLYHRKSPIDHIQQLFDLLRPGGELVLETLVVTGDKQQVLVPDDRYAKMRNVWFLPSAKALELWLNRVGFTHVELIDLDQTSIDEQRRTDWMTNESLADFLDPNDVNKTVEGHPAPLRAALIAKKPI